MSTSNIQTLADSEANERPPMLKKRNYIPWESRFKRFLDNKLEDGERMWNSITNGAYKRPMITNPDNDQEAILEPLSKMTQVSINTKFLNCLQPEWSKYVTMVRHNQTGDIVSYDVLYDSLVQFEPHVLASKAKKAAKNHDPLALLAHSIASSSQSHANSSYSPQPYYVTHPSSVVDYEDEYQGELQGDSQEDKLTTSMMLLARAITQKFFIPTNNYLRTSSNTRNQVMVQDEEIMEELSAVVLLMAQIQPADGNAETVPSYYAKAISEVNASSKVHEQVSHMKCKTIIQTSNDDQTDSNIIFDDPFVENNGGTSDHDSNTHAELGYKNPERLKKAIAAQPKMYDGEKLHSTKLVIDSPHSEKTLEDAEESRLKMRNKMVQIN
ncbi:hypothetical protein Tco_1087496 [Tanacetum coccineum]